MVFTLFTPVSPISEDTIAEFGPRVPPGVAQAWGKYGSGFVGDGYFRFVDPGRAAKMLSHHSPIPSDAVVLFTTALADLVVWWNSVFLVVKTRLGEIHPEAIPFDQIVDLMEDIPQRDEVWDWHPFTQVRDRLGEPGFEECFMHVPMLALGGRGDPEAMQTGNLWKHISMMVQFTGRPKVTHILPLPFDLNRGFADEDEEP
ncbi:MAG: DUF1851 domain-containing protein [Propionibacteriaceae bacterium]|jgi:hypothetical protein|nr:DUF1851 domain-containing protein [Propionibacteriaceae bacterium]